MIRLNLQSLHMGLSTENIAARLVLSMKKTLKFVHAKSPSKVVVEAIFCLLPLNLAPATVLVEVLSLCKEGQGRQRHSITSDLHGGLNGRRKVRRVVDRYSCFQSSRCL